MTLVDTSAWIEFFRRKGDPKIKKRVGALFRNDATAYVCPTYYELMLGARPHEEANIQAVLAESNRIYFNDAHWNQAAFWGRELRRSGVTVPTIDLLVATVAISESLRVLCRDIHFARMQDVLGDRLQLEVIS